MKKIMFLTLFVAGLLTTACDKGDYDDWAQPQSNEQKDAITVPGFTATAAGAVDLNIAGDSVKVISLSQAQLPEGATVGNVRMEVAPESNLDNPVTIKALTADGLFAKSQLQETVVGFFGPRPDVRTLAAHVFANVITGGQAAYVDCGEVMLTITPKAPHISSKYYLVGGPLDWAASAASKEQVFTHSSKDVYEDPVFTYEMESTGGEMWFAFGDDEALDAITVSSDWTKLFGTKGEAQDLSGSFDYRYNLGGEHSFCVDGSAPSYRISVNMLDMTYEITPLSAGAVFDTPSVLYLTGNNYGWGETWVPLVPVHSHSTMSWIIIYLHEGEEFKFAPQQGWGDDFGMNVESVVDNAGMNPGGNNNIVVGTPGWYLIRVDNTPGKRVVEFNKPNIYLMGDVTGGWNISDEWLFTVPESETEPFVSPAFINDAEVRMCVKFDNVEWWQTEFLVNASGQINYRGAGNDQPRLRVRSGQKCYLNFAYGTGSYK